MSLFQPTLAHVTDKATFEMGREENHSYDVGVATWDPKKLQLCYFLIRKLPIQEVKATQAEGLHYCQSLGFKGSLSKNIQDVIRSKAISKQI